MVITEFTPITSAIGGVLIGISATLLMAMNGRIHSASLTTVTFDLHDGGTRLTYCEQMTLIGESDGAAGRTHGWTHLLDALERIAVQFADAD